MLYIAFFSVLIVLVARVFIARKIKAKIQNEEFPFIKKDYLLTRAEKDFYFVLQKAVSNDYLLFSKVRMIDLFYLPKGTGNSRYYHFKNKIQSKHVDFLLCNKENVKPLLAIELDDSSHNAEERIFRDTLEDTVFKQAQLPILHIRVASSYDGNELLSQIKTLLETNYQAPTSPLVG